MTGRGAVLLKSCAKAYYSRAGGLKRIRNTQIRSTVVRDGIMRLRARTYAVVTATENRKKILVQMITNVRDVHHNLKEWRKKYVTCVPPPASLL